MFNVTRITLFYGPREFAGFRYDGCHFKYQVSLTWYDLKKKSWIGFWTIVKQLHEAKNELMLSDNNNPVHHIRKFSAIFLERRLFRIISSTQNHDGFVRLEVTGMPSRSMF